MIKRDVAAIIDKQFKIFRGMILKHETHMLRKGYVPKEAFIQASFSNLRRGLEMLHDTIRANYERQESGKGRA